VIGKQPVKPRQHPPGRPEMAIVDARRLDVVVNLDRAASIGRRRISSWGRCQRRRCRSPQD
jgi:hypothetical protein